MSHAISIDYQDKVIYDQDHWQLFRRMREQAKELLDALKQLHAPAFVYGSLARGDIQPSSDIDIIISQKVPSYQIIHILEEEGYQILNSKIVMATPNHAIKGQIDLPGEITLSFPLHPLKPREMAFYDFGGKIDLEGIKQENRVPGVDKHLCLIIPNEQGHKAISILSMSSHTLQQYGIDQEIVSERIRVLKRREKVGRTGVFVDEPVDPELGFEGTLRQIQHRNNLVRNRMRR